MATENAAAMLRKINPKLSISTAVIEGSSKVVILEEAEKFGANLIVVGLMATEELSQVFYWVRCLGRWLYMQNVRWKLYEMKKQKNKF